MTGLCCVVLRLFPIMAFKWRRRQRWAMLCGIENLFNMAFRGGEGGAESVSSNVTRLVVLCKVLPQYGLRLVGRRKEGGEDLC